MALSSVSYVGDGTEDEFSFSNISLLDDDIVTYASQLRVYVDGVLKTLTTDYTVDVINNKITFGAGSIPALGTIVKIARFSKSDDRYITYTNSTNITASILNTDADHLFHLAQEALDLRDTAITLTEEDVYNANSKVITNLAPGVDSTDAVNYGQMIAAISGDNPGVLGTQGYYTAVGDGSEVNYTLPTSISGLTASDFNVYVNGSKKIPTTDYTITGVVLTFTVAPTSTHVIQILWNIGTVPARFGEGNVSTTMLQDKAVTAPKIGSLSATSNQVLVADGSGGASFGTTTASIISDFNTAVQTNRLDQLAVPTASVNFNTQRLTNLAAPSASTDGINRNYLDTNYWQSRTYNIAPASRTVVSTTNQTYTLTHNLTTVHRVSLIIPVANGTSATFYNIWKPLISINTSLGVMYLGYDPVQLATATTPIGYFAGSMTITSGQIVFNITSSVANTLVTASFTTPTTGYLSKNWIIQLEGV